MSEAAWNKAFTQGSKAMQDRLRKVHAKNPKFQAWLQKSGHGAGVSVKQASKEVKATERAKKLAQQSLKAYGATKGRRMGGEDGSGETLRDTIAPLTRDQHSKVQAAQRAAKAAAKPAKPAAPKKPLTKDQRLAVIAAAARKAKAKHDVPTIDVEDDHDDLRDVHQSLHIRRGYNEEMEKVNEIVGVLAAMDKADKARSSNLKVGDNVRSIKMPIPGKVEKIENGKVYFRHESGKLYATHAGNLRKEEVELEEADMSNKEKKKEYVRQVGLKAMKQGKVDPARGHSPQRFGREILKGAAADRAVRKAMEKEMTRMGEEAELTEGRMKDIDTERKETARLATQEKDLPFTPDKNPVRRGRGGPMSQAKWLAKQAMMKKMKEMGMKEEVEQIDEGFSHFQYTGEVNGKEYELTIPRHRDLGDYPDAALHRKLSKENPHLAHHEVTAIVDSGGEEKSKVDVEHKGKKYTHHVINHQEPGRLYSEEIEQVEEGDLSIRTLYNKYADHYTSDKGNSAKRADAVEKAITKVHGPKVMKHLEKAVKANLRGDMDQEENHFERARNTAEKSGSDRVGATVGRDRSKFRKEEVHQTDEAIRVKDISVSNTLGSLKKAKPGANFIAKDRAEISRSIAAHDVKSVRKKTAGNPDMRKAALKRAGYEVVKEVAEEPKHGDAGEYDYEGDMAKSQLRSIMTNAKRMHDMLEDNTNLPEWVQSKITLAEDYVLTAANYMEGEMNEEVEQIDEASHFRYGGEVNGKEYEVTIPRHRDLGDYSDAALHRKLSKENPHLDHHEVTAIVHSGGEEESKVDVEHEGKKYTHHVINYQEPQRIYSEALDPVGKEDKDIDNDGDSDKTDVYLATKRKAIGKAIKDRLAKKLGK